MAISLQDRALLLRCEEVKNLSHDPHRKVGVVIADARGSILAEGANAPPKALGLTAEDSHAFVAEDPMWKYFVLEHAERNAIFAAQKGGVSLAGTTMYGSLFPCADCARAIAACGIGRIVVSTADRDPVRDAKWRDHFTYAKLIFERAGVDVEFVDADTKQAV